MTQPQGSPLAVPLPWDLVSSAYSEEVVPLFEAFSREALRLAGVPAGSRIVDVACGPGTLSVLAAQAGCAVDAIDFSPQMIEKLSARIGSLPITARLGDGQALPYPDATFDAGFSMFGLMFFPDRAKGFAELRRVLRPGAKAVVSSWPPFDNIPACAAMMGAIRETMGKAMGTPPPPDRPSPLTTVEECRAEMSVSFADVEVHEFATTQRTESADALWESFTRTMAPVALMKKSLGDKFAAVDAAAREAIRGAIGKGPAEQTLKAHLTVGTAR
ncbi:MAG TPA: methyltransferase domain-containing protein [Kofleriaceae bacterium]